MRFSGSAPREKFAFVFSMRLARAERNWHKEIEALVSSVERAWAATERMRAAVEDRGSRNVRSRPLNDGFWSLKAFEILQSCPEARTPEAHGSSLATEL